MANNRSYILYMFAFGLFVPLVVIICSYVSILRVVKQVILILRRRGTYFSYVKGCCAVVIDIRFHYD
jgi:hypothetical protein